MNFDFITDGKFRFILKRDFEELNKCIETKASKSVLILSGSIIESVLTDYFSNFPPNGVVPEKILSMDLASLIDLAIDHKLISKSTKDLSTVIRNYRNLIHPGREIRKQEKFDYDSALVAKSLLNIILKEIKENYINQIGYTSLDIISKLENDSISKALFDKIISKLHKNEKIKLYNLLVEYDLKEISQPTQLSDPKKYISILKSQVDREVVNKQLMKLVDKIEMGVKWEVMTYYHLLHDDLTYLDENNLELILLYVINALSESTNNVVEMKSYVDKKLFSTFGTHLITEEIKKEILNLLCNIVKRHRKRDFLYFEAYDQVINSIDNDKKDKAKNYIYKIIETHHFNKFYKDYNDGDFLPF
ncbi:MAG: hypothetical protein WD449_00790 [Candidatus Babeliales bacterium]